MTCFVYFILLNIKMFRAIQLLVIISTVTGIPSDELQVTTAKKENTDGGKQSYDNRTETSTPEEQPSNFQPDQYEYLTVDSIFTYTDTEGKQNIGVGCESDYSNFTARALMSNESSEQLVRARFGLRRGRIFQCNFTDGKVLHYVSYGKDKAGFIVTDLTHFPLVTTTTSTSGNSDDRKGSDKLRNETSTSNEEPNDNQPFQNETSTSNEEPNDNQPFQNETSTSNEEPNDNQPFQNETSTSNEEPNDNQPFQYIFVDSLFTYLDSDGKRIVGVGCVSEYLNFAASALISNKSGEKLVRARFKDTILPVEELKYPNKTECRFIDGNVLRFVRYEVDKAGFIVTALINYPLVVTMSKYKHADDGIISFIYSDQMSNPWPYQYITVDSVFTYTDADGKQKVGIGCESEYRNFTASALMSNESGEKLVRVRFDRKSPYTQTFQCNFTDGKVLHYVSYGVDDAGFIVKDLTHFPLVTTTVSKKENSDFGKGSDQNRTKTSTPDQYKYLTVDSIFTYTDTDGKQKIGVGCVYEYLNFTASALKKNESGEKLVRSKDAARSEDREFECSFNTAEGETNVLYTVDEEGFIVTEVVLIDDFNRHGVLDPVVVATMLG